MSDLVYANTDSLNNLITQLKNRCEAIISSGEKFYQLTNGVRWDDRVFDEAIEHYRKAILIAETVLQAVDGLAELLKEEIEDLNNYLSVEI